MKKIFMMMSILFASTLFAGGDIAPVEAPAIVAPDASGFYLGTGYSYTTADASVGIISADDNLNTLALIAGYKVNEYIAVEGRYSMSNTGNMFSDFDTNYDTWAVYAKPMYPVTEELDVYALVGYAKSDFIDNDGGFSYGAGASYEVLENVEFFVDYTVLADNTIAVVTGNDVDMKISAWTAGVNYKF